MLRRGSSGSGSLEVRLSWADFERIQRALDDNPLDEVNEIYAFLRSCRFQDMHFFLNLIRIWASAERDKNLQRAIVLAFFTLFDGLLMHLGTLGEDYWEEILNRLKRAVLIVQNFYDMEEA